MSKTIYYRDRGGQVRTGRFLHFVGEDRMRVVTSPGSRVATTIMPRSWMRTAQEVCRMHNRLWNEVRELVEHA